MPVRKNIVVSGATKGIGRAIVEKFFDEGFDVAFCARNGKELNVFKNELEARSQGQKVLAIQCDVSDKAEVQAFAQQAALEFEHIDVLVNNAGVFYPGKISDEEDGIFELQMQTNLASAYHLSRALLPYMNKGGHLFNMCSTASITAYTNGGSYCISKYALLGLSKVLREELKKEGIRVTAVLPGATLTGSWEGTELPQEKFIPSPEIADCIWHCWKLSPRTVVEELLIRPQEGDIL
jgi:NAD(P)-dependent dehydrogenase (short-subunit alcohol dehydrogenase family)